jgi:cellulose synthase operon protein C
VNKPAGNSAKGRAIIGLFLWGALCFFQPSVQADEAALERFERLLEAGESAQAAQGLAGWIKANPQDVQAALVLGKHYAETGSPELALPVLSKALALAKDENSYVAAAGQLANAGHAAAAVELLVQGRRYVAGDRPFSIALADLHLRRQDYKAATTEYLAYLKVQPQRLGQVVHLLGRVSADSLRAPKLLDALEAAVDLGPDRNSAMLFAYTAAAAEQPARGLKALQAKAADPQVAEALFQFASRCEAQEYYDTAVDAYRLFVVYNKESPYRHQALLRQAELESRRQRHADASATYRRLVAEAPQRPEAIEALLELGRLILERGDDTAAARQTLEQVLNVRSRGPRADQARLLLAEVALRQGQLDEAVGHLEYVGGQAFDAEVRFRQSELDFFAADFDAARQGFEAFSRQSPQDGRANDALDLLLILEEYAEEGAALETYALARWRQRQGDRAGAAVAWKQLAAKASAGLRQRALFEQARAAEKAGDATALELYGRLDGDYAVEGHLGQARLLEEQGDLQGALRAYETFLLHFGDDPQGPLIRLRIQHLRPLLSDPDQG